MPLTPTITMIGAVKADSSITITANLKVNNGVGDVIDKDFSAIFRKTHNDIVKDVQQDLFKQMQVEIDKHKAGVLIEEDARFLAMKNNIETNLVM